MPNSNNKVELSPMKKNLKKNIDPNLINKDLHNLQNRATAIENEKQFRASARNNSLPELDKINMRNGKLG